MSVVTAQGKGRRSLIAVALPPFVGELKNTQARLVNDTHLLLNWSPPAESVNKSYIVSLFNFTFFFLLDMPRD